jgi:protein TonB
MKLYATSTCRDTLFKNRFGWMVRYFKNGSLRDSTEYDLKGSAVSIKTFYTNGLLRTSIIKREDRVIVGQSFDEEGKLSETFTKVETSFPGGMDAWSEYLKGHLRQNLPVRQGAPPGKYTVILNFSIDTNGNIQNITADNDPGYGTKEEAIRVLSKSPKWIPATQNGIKVISKHKQSITFEVSEK